MSISFSDIEASKKKTISRFYGSSIFQSWRILNANHPVHVSNAPLKEEAPSDASSARRTPSHFTYMMNMGHAWWQHAVHKCRHSRFYFLGCTDCMRCWVGGTTPLDELRALQSAAHFCHLRADDICFSWNLFGNTYAMRAPFDTRRHKSCPAPATLLLLLLLWLFNCTQPLCS